MNKYYYKYVNGDRFIKVIGRGNDPADCVVVWVSSANAEGDRAIIEGVEIVQSPVYGQVDVIKHPENIYTQVLRMGILIRDGYRCVDYSAPKLKPIKSVKDW